MLTIGDLAKRTGLRTSALRYYEEQGLLQPAERTASGYRLYADNAEQTVRLIQRTQRLGFSLTEIRLLLEGMAAGNLTDAAILQTAEARYLLLEEEITALLVVRHELGLFWQDLHHNMTQPAPLGAIDRQQAPVGATDRQQAPLGAIDRLTQLVQQICGDPQTQAARLFDWLLRKTGCELATHEARDLFTQLRGQHIHIWQEADAYHILVVSTDPQIGRVLAALTQLETHCQVHAHQQQAPELMHNDEGYLVVARGAGAFIFARLFLAFAEAQV